MTDTMPAAAMTASHALVDPASLPTGMVTFLFTDVEGSTKMLQAHPDAYRIAVRRHHDLLTEAVTANGGAVFETVGDAVYAAFPRPTDAVRAALGGQLALQAEAWGETGRVRVRMGVHLGEAELQFTGQGAHYFGAPLYRCARIMTTAHGGQVVLSEVAAAAVRDGLPVEVTLRDLGEHRLKDWARSEHIYQAVHPRLPEDFPPLRTPDALPNNLPPQMTSFIGREQDIAEVKRWTGAEGRRMVTLMGTGGTGKTRLALEVASSLLDRYREGAWLIELASLSDPAVVPQAVAAVMGVRQEPGVPLTHTLAEVVRGKRMLLILDNCEHLIDATASLSQALLRASDGLHILATSREALGVAGESTWHVPSLALPDRDAPPPPGEMLRYEAIRLFVERAQAALPDFSLSAASTGVVCEICHRLDGIPLAIELAAARVRLLTPEQLLTRLEDAFRILTGGSRTVLARQRTLQALIDWSYDLLSAPEQQLFNRLSIFAGGFTLEAAEALGAGDGIEEFEVLDLLALLVDKSLVIPDAIGPSHDGGPSASRRYHLLETLRQYGRQRLGAEHEATMRARHSAHFASLAREGESKLRTWEETQHVRAARDEQAATATGNTTVGPHRERLDQLEAEYENLRSALHWSMEQGEAAQSAALAGALWLALEHRLSLTG